METIEVKRRKSIERKIRFIKRKMSDDQSGKKKKLTQKNLAVIAEMLELLTHDLMNIVDKIIDIEKRRSHV